MITKQIAILISFVCLVAFADAQITFQKIFGLSSYCYSTFCQQTFDGGYAIFGYDGDYWIMKLNAYGDTIWTKTYGTIPLDVAFSAQQTSDSSFIMAGYTKGALNNNTELYLLKINSVGDTIWTRSYGHTGEYKAYAVKETSDGGYVLCGSAHNIPGGGSRDFFLLKANSNGDTLWTRKFGSISDDYGYSVQETFDSGFIMCGTSSYNNISIIKTNSLGTILWSKEIPATSSHGNSIIQLPDSSYVIGCRLNDNFGLIKTNSLGDVIWAKSFSNTHPGFCRSIIETSDGGIIATGFICLNDSCNSDKFFVVKTNVNGDTIFTRTLGGTYLNRAYCINQTSDNGFIISGYTTSFGGGNNVYVIKTDADGFGGCNQNATPVTDDTLNLQSVSSSLNNYNSVWSYYVTTTYINSGCSDTTLCSYVGIEEMNGTENDFIIYPNPNRGKFQIISSNINITNVEIYNLLGIKQFSIQTNNNKSITVNENFSPGVYFVKISDRKNISVKKILIE